MGVPVGSMTVRIYMLSSVLAGIAGIVFSFYTAAGYSLVRGRRRTRHASPRW